MTAVVTPPAAAETIIADKNYYGTGFNASLADGRISCSALSARASRDAPATGSSSRCARSSNRSMAL
jgi:hypothetical protein